ncbi:MAG: hypothetical protein ACPGPH_04605, partial [Synechococcus sp.]
MHSSLHALPVLQDNVIWIWVRGAEAVVIDPAVAPPVRAWLDAVPPIFGNCTARLSRRDEVAARDAYWEAVTLPGEA